MPTAKRIIQSEFPYHVTIRASEREPFPLDLDYFWRYSSDLLLFCSYAFKIEVHCYVLMSNHYHLLVRTPEANLDKFMKYFNKQLSREICRRSVRFNHRFGSRYYSSVVATNRYYETVYKYIYRNPVSANICDKVETYPFSSLNFVLAKEKYLFPVHDEHFQNIEDHWPALNWLNTPFESDAIKDLKLGPRGYQSNSYHKAGAAFAGRWA